MNGLSDIFYLSKSTAAKGNEPLASVEGESTSDLFFMYGIPYCMVTKDDVISPPFVMSVHMPVPFYRTSLKQHIYLASLSPWSSSLV